jgi:hypothetical protein
MAGSFGFEAEHYKLSMSIGEIRLFPAVRAEADATIIAATGVSCRQQISLGTGRIAQHPLEIVQQALASPATPGPADQSPIAGPAPGSARIARSRPVLPICLVLSLMIHMGLLAAFACERARCPGMLPEPKAGPARGAWSRVGGRDPA